MCRHPGRARQAAETNAVKVPPSPLERKRIERVPFNGCDRMDPMTRADDVTRLAYPLFHAGSGGSNPTSALSAKSLRFDVGDKSVAVQLVRQWHSRLPACQESPWQYAFYAEHEGTIYAVALWNNPSGRCLPSHWLELRRMACAPDAPRNTCSRFLGYMVRYFKTHCPDREKCISYQDTAVHEGTIYKAAGWVAEHESKTRVRDRSKNRVGTDRAYRSNLNGVDADSAAKIRWGISLAIAGRHDILAGAKKKASQGRQSLPARGSKTATNRTSIP
jgi:hypothetical protein